jgi:small subunit ribosomal protein S7
MPRRKRESLKKREIGVDPVYGSELIQKFINIIMERGKKSIARKIVYDALAALAEKSSGNKDKALELFLKAFDQVVPLIEVRPRRVGGSVYQIPVEVGYHRGRALAMRWLVEAASSRTDKTMGTRLARELIEAAEGRGNAIKKKLDVHRMAEANRAFSHYAW